MNEPKRLLIIAFLLTLFAIPIGITMAGGANGSAFRTFLTVQTVHAQTPSVKSFDVMITSSGFNDGTLDISVNQGDTVKITFTMDQDQRSNTDPSNHHIIAITGYDVRTAEITPSNPSATITFTADKAGSFTIYCETPECPIHYLMLSGVLEVKNPGQTVNSTTTTTTQVQVPNGSQTGKVDNEYLVVKPDLGGPGYDMISPNVIVVQQGDLVNMTVRNADNEGFTVKIENVTTVNISPGRSDGNTTDPVDSAIPIFNATNAGIFGFSALSHPELNGVLVVLPSDWSQYNPAPKERHYNLAVLPDFAGDGYDVFFPSAIVVNQGDDVSIDVRNTDAMPHGFALPAFGVNVAIDPARELANGTTLPIVTNVPKFNASSPGIYVFLCTVPCGQGHTQMVGVVVVLPKAGAPYNPQNVPSYNYLTVSPDFAGAGYDKFVPGTLFANQGDLVYIKVRNTDTMPHGFTLPSFGINNETISSAETSGNETIPTDTYITPFVALQPGVYVFFCTIPCGEGHFQMIGYIVVLPKLNGAETTQTTSSSTVSSASTSTSTTSADTVQVGAAGVPLQTASTVAIGMVIAGFLVGLVVTARFVVPRK